MRILITGGKGMLGRTLVRHWQGKHTLAIADLPEVDLTRPESVEEAFEAFSPECVVHCAAMTQVDACETEQAKAFLINAEATGNVARACAKHHARLIAISTDYVFSGDEPGEYTEADTPSPRTVYGASKLAGEEAIRATCPDAVIARIAWLYGSGGPSFVHTMVKLAQADPKRELKVVNDQVGNPTSADAVADALEAFLARPELRGTFHLTCEGVASWFDFAQAVFEGLGYREVKLRACTTEEFPRPAPRPHNSALSKQKLATVGLPPMPPWRDALCAFLRQEWGR